MPRCRMVVIPLLAILFATLPSAYLPVVSDVDSSSGMDGSRSPIDSTIVSDTQTGTLNPVLIEHNGASTGMTQSDSARTDVNPNPSSEAYLPAGAPDNYYSGEGEGGYYLVGSGGSADFGSAAGTISFWGKWDVVAPHGRFWGQHANFETRWASNRLVLDWGSDIAIQGIKTDWEIDHWYFIAIAWNESTNYLAIFWGDETTEPQEDVSTTFWTASTIGLHTENNIMNSIGRTTAQVDGHVDDFRYYTSQRNLTEIQSDYLPTSAGTDGSLSAHYRFENDLTDSVGNLDLQVSGACSISRDVPRTPEGWYGDQIKVTVSEIRKLFALNGTFETGNPGTNEDWFGDGLYYADGWLAQREVLSGWGRQRTSYVEDVDSYVLVENEGYYANPNFRHYNGTRVFWYQNVDNSDLNELFFFSMDYMYMRGPLGTNFAGIFELRFEILDGSSLLWNWSIDLTNVTQRQTWFDTGQMLVNITNAPSSFEARVVLSVDTVSSYIAISEIDSDLDGDSTNGQFLTVHLNNLELKSTETLTCEEVELVVDTLATGSVTFSSLGVALINHTHWTDAIVPIDFTSNTSIAFDFSAEFSKMHRFYNSSATTNLDILGASYAVDLDTSVNLTFYTYVQSSPEAKDLGFIIYCPCDWENATVEDPFGIPVGVNQSEFIEVPSGSVDSVGWWKIALDGPNYAQSVVTQVQDESEWGDETIFQSGNKIRCSADIGTLSSTVSSVSNLQMTWYLPSDSIWSFEIAANASGSHVVSNGLVLGPANATTGEWLVSVMWTNGTEVAFGSATFEVHHQLTMFSHRPHIDALLDEVFTAAVYLFDQDTGTPIMSDAIVVGNWSTSEVPFSPNLAKGWWEADVNSSLVGTGSFCMVVNATMPFHLMTNYTITIEITTVTIMTVLGDLYVEIDPDDSYEVKMRYMFLDGVGIEGAQVSVLSYSGPQDGLLCTDAQSVFGEPGNYTIEFTASLSGTYFITIVASKEDHSIAATSFYIIVGAVSAEVDVYGVEPPEILYYNHTCTISLFYHTAGLSGIEEATVNATYHPASIIEWIEVDDGYYNVSIRVPEVGTHAVYLRFSKFGFDFADISFVFEVIEVPTSISDHGLIGAYYEGRTYGFAFYYNSSLGNGILGAELTSSASIREFFELSGSGAGWYNFTLTPTSGDWPATFLLTRIGFEEQIFSFTLHVDKIPIELSPNHPLNSTYTRLTQTVFTLTLLPLSGDTSAIIAGATISYILIHTNGAGDVIVAQGVFIETPEYYSANVSVPEVGLYVLRISISKEHHETLIREIVISAIANPELLFASYLQAGLLGALTLLVCIASFVIGRRFYTSTTAKRNLDLMELKERLEDAKNLIGLLVIQRKAGLPVFSKIIKGGFEASMLSAFISAISQFREEFSWDSPKWTAIPISEVVTAVQSEELICAIITLESASIRQKNQLETFSREIGGRFDHDDRLIATIHRANTEEVVEIFDKVFDDYFDGVLFGRYVGVKKDFPNRLSPITSAFKTMNIDRGVSPEAIIKSVILLGFSERAVINMVMEAIDNGYLIAAEKRLPPPPEPEE